MDARKLVGMSQRRRKEMFHAEFEAARNKDGTVSMFVADAFLSKYYISQRLRPCPGCAECGSSVRRFAPTAGWKFPRKWVLWDGAQLWMIARTWRRKCAIPNLSDYLAAVEDGTWTELFCNGSGVLPAKKAKVK